MALRLLHRSITTVSPSFPPRRRIVPSSSSSPLTPNAPPLATHSVLSLLARQPAHYTVVFVLGRKYRLQCNDVLTIPRANDLRVGDVIELTRVVEVGSRLYSLRACENGTVGHAKRETAPPTHGLEGIREAVRPSAGATMLKPTIPHYFNEGIVNVKAMVVEHTRGELQTTIKKKRRKGYRKTILGKAA